MSIYVFKNIYVVWLLLNLRRWPKGSYTNYVVSMPMHPDAIRMEMDADEYAEFLAHSEARRELMGESFD